MSFIRLNLFDIRRGRRVPIFFYSHVLRIELKILPVEKWRRWTNSGSGISKSKATFMGLSYRSLHSASTAGI